MGCGGSSTAKVGPTAATPVSEAEQVENDIAELRKTFDKYSKGTSGVILESELGKFYEEVCGVPLEPEERKAALGVIYKGRRQDGLVPFDAFMKWFRTDDDPEGAEAPTPQEIPASVKKGLKEDGEAAGSAKDWEDRRGPSQLEFEGIPAAN
mmetsp:Transcript_10164/g.21429  ORF Transcript_10164/g.21429 Transcript_10164/m.21429 type:complete len:152 (-) Transcript_10164:344-799(-)